ncbi:MAG: DUF3467 domain-containing protein [Planctomycetaceae bacterium]
MDDVNPDIPDPRDDDDELPQPVQGQVRHQSRSARVPEQVGAGVFSNGVMILTGQYECLLDFVLRMGEVQRVVTRVVLPPVVARQFERALRDNLHNYETRFGTVPRMPRPVPQPADDEDEVPREPGSAPVQIGGTGGPQPPRATQIDDIYHDLRFPEDLYSGRYANAVLIRHSGTEFCFDFLCNAYPKSVVSARVFLAAPHVPPFLESLTRSLQPPEPPGTLDDTIA